MRYDFAELERLLLVQIGPRLTDTGQHAGKTRLVAEALGTSPRQVYRWRQIGVTAEQAESLAPRVGFVPYEVWPEMLDHVLAAEAEARRVRKREQQRRWITPERAAGYWARYYAENGDYVRSAVQRRYWSDPEKVRAQKRDRYHSDPEYRERKLAAQRERDRAKARTKNKDTTGIEIMSDRAKNQYDYKDAKHPVMEDGQKGELQAVPHAHSASEHADGHSLTVTDSVDTDGMENAA